MADDFDLLIRTPDGDLPGQLLRRTAMNVSTERAHRQLRAAKRRRLRWLNSIIVAPALIVALLVPPAASQNCPGDCSGDRAVTVDELLACLRIALEPSLREQCVACDTNLDGTVSIDEVVGAVGAALRLLVVEARGTCVRPGPTGLIPCAEGTVVQVGRCDDRTACLRNSNAVVAVTAEPVGPNGSFSLSMDRCRVTGAALVFEADVAPETATKYRTMDFGSLASGFALGVGGGGVPSIDDVLIGPASEAAVRVLRENGLENFDNQGAAEVFTTAETSNSDTDFSGLDADSAADLAEQTAVNDPAVEVSVERGRTLCTQTEFTLLLDDGTPLQGIGVNNLTGGGNQGFPFIWLNRHAVNGADLPIRITALSNVWPEARSALLGGEMTELLVYLDADADGDPGNAELLASQPLAVPTPSDAVRYVHPFEEPVIVNNPGDVYIGFADLETGIDHAIRFMALQDDSGGGARSFIIFNDDPLVPIDVVSLGDNDFIQQASAAVPGAWLVRAQGMCDD